MSWEAQAQGLCVESANALGVARFGLTKELAASALGLIRFVLETRCLVDWLLDDEAARTSRALGLGIREVEDWRRNLSAEPKEPGARADYDRYLKSPTDDQTSLLHGLERQIRQRALALRVVPEAPPKTLKALMDNLFQDDTAYRIFSDLGSHVGLGTTFLIGGAETPAKLRERRSVLARAFCLGLSAAVHMETAEVVAEALGQLDQVRQVQEYRAAQRALLERVVVLQPTGGDALFSG